MKKIEMSPDQFSKFIAEQILKVENYSFDVFYDIAKIMKIFIENRSTLDKEIIETFHLMIRNTGFDLVKTDNSEYKTFFQKNSEIYHLSFCWNYSYMHKKPFCEVEKIK